MTNLRMFLFENVYCNRLDDIAEHIKNYFIVRGDVDVDLKTFTIEFPYMRACSSVMPEIWQGVKDCIFAVVKECKERGEISEEDYEYCMNNQSKFFLIGLLNHGRVMIKL